MPLRRVRSTLLLLAALSGAACGERATGPVTATVPVALALVFPAGTPGANAVFGAGIDRARVVISRPNEALVLDTTFAFPAGDEVLTLGVQVPVLGRVDTMYVQVDLIEGQATNWNASGQIVVREGGLPSIPALPLTYAGPGWDAVSFSITGRGSVVVPTGTLAMAATALNSQGAPVTTPIAWSVSDRLMGSIDAAGTFTARERTGTVWVRAAIPAGFRDSVLVTVATQ